MVLLKLPPDALECVLSMLSTRNLQVVSCTCRSLRAACAHMPLHPVIRDLAMRAWLIQPAVSSRVLSLTARMCLWGPCRFLENLGVLRRLVVTFCRVHASIVRSLPTTLEHLELHRIEGRYGDAFFTSRLGHLHRLHTLKLTFTHHWDLVVMGDLDKLPLRRLTVRLAQAIIIRTPLAIQTVILHAVSALVTPFEILSENLSLRCDEGRVAYDVALTPRSAARVRNLSLHSPLRTTVPYLSSMRALESLSLTFDSASVSVYHLSGLPRLARVVLDTKYGVAVTGAQACLPSRVRVLASVAGVPLSDGETRALFYGSSTCACSP